MLRKLKEKTSNPWEKSKESHRADFAEKSPTTPFEACPHYVGEMSLLPYATFFDLMYF
jgi:hypothetical protein